MTMLTVMTMFLIYPFTRIPRNTVTIVTTVTLIVK